MKNETLELLRSPVFLNELFKNIEISIARSFWRLYDNKMSFNNLLHGKKNKNVQLNKISVCFAENFEQELFFVLKYLGVDCKYIDNEEGDFEIENEPWELKTSRENLGNSKQTLQGATHSSSKCKNYIFIRYGVNMDKKFLYLRKSNDVINRLHFSVHHNIVDQKYWIGNASGNNSRTTLKIPISEYSDFNNGVVYGNINPSVKYLQFKTEQFNLTKYEKTILSEILEKA
jgi:hypothetical protein